MVSAITSAAISARKVASGITTVYVS